MSVPENSKFISLVPDNGTEFIAEQKAIFTINPDIGFIKGRDSYRPNGYLFITKRTAFREFNQL